MTKKIILSILAVTLILSMVTVTATAAVPGGGRLTYFRAYYCSKILNGEIDPSKEPEHIIGDPSYDGKINAEDAMITLKMAVNFSEWSVKRCENVYVLYYVYAQQNVINNSGVWDYLEANGRLLADVNMSLQCDAGDALQILQYAVGKRTEFDRKDMTGNGLRHPFMVWFDEWYPTMYWNLGGGYYDLITWPPVTTTDVPSTNRE